MKLRMVLVLLGIVLVANFALAQEKMTVKDSDSNVLMEVNDEGTMGSITLPDTSDELTSDINKLYNWNGTLMWNGSALGTAGSAGGWTDGGTVVYLSNGTDKVGIGDTSPTNTLDVAGTIGINDTQVVYLPDQTAFEGTLILGSGGRNLLDAGGLSGKYNTSAGIGTLHSNTTGSYNSVFGYRALYRNQTGYSNTGIGAAVLEYNVEGQSNTAIGISALNGNTTGNNNVGIGTWAYYKNQSGSNNTIIGYLAGGSSTARNGSGNVFIGHQAGYNETGDNKLYIENSSTSSPLIGGDFDAGEVYLNGYVGIGISNPVCALDVNGRIELSDNDATDIAGSGAIEIGNELRIDRNEIITNTGSILYLQKDGDSDLEVDSGTLFVDASENRVGVATTSPDAELDVNGTTILGNGGTAISKVLSASAFINFLNTNPGTSQDLTMTVTGAADGDPVFLGVPNGSVYSEVTFFAWVSSDNTVTIRLMNNSSVAVNPVGTNYRVTVFKF